MSALERAQVAYDEWLTRQLALAEATGFRLAVAIVTPEFNMAGMTRLDGFVMLAPGESPPKRRGVSWTIYEQVGGEWRGRSA